RCAENTSIQHIHHRDDTITVCSISSASIFKLYNVNKNSRKKSSETRHNEENGDKCSNNNKHVSYTDVDSSNTAIDDNRNGSGIGSSKTNTNTTKLWSGTV
ncbi:MAG: hypothetical protein ACTSX1_08065, partial [Candidatus Heimdallarchaeaceae archaeon]